MARGAVRDGVWARAADRAQAALSLWRGEALDGAGQPGAARTELVVMLRLAERAGHAYQVTSAHRALAESYHRAGQHEQARHHTDRALA